MSWNFCLKLCWTPCFRKFHTLAERMLNKFYNDDKELTRKMIVHNGTETGDSNIELAVAVGNEDFIAHSSCQNVLSTKWGGDLMLEEDKKFKVNYLYLKK